MLVQELFHEKRKTSSTTMSPGLIPNGLWSMSLGNFYGVTWLSGLPAERSATAAFGTPVTTTDEPLHEPKE